MGISKNYFMEMRASQDYISEGHIIGSDKKEEILKFINDLTSLSKETTEVIDELKKIQSNDKRN